MAGCMIHIVVTENGKWGKLIKSIKGTAGQKAEHRGLAGPSKYIVPHCDTGYLSHLSKPTESIKPMLGP